MTRMQPIPSAEVIELESKVLELRRAGVHPTEIARQLHISKATVYARIKGGLTRTLKEPAAEVRDLEADRLDRLQAAIWPKALRGDLRAVDRVIRISERRAELLGLDHKHGIAERSLQLEADRVRLIALATGRMLDELDLSPAQREQAMRTLLTELRVAEAAEQEQYAEDEPAVLPASDQE
jgi:hypothetical protein